VTPLALLLAAGLTLAGASIHASPAGDDGPARPAPPLHGGPSPDAWLAEDKLRHLGASFAIASFASAGARGLGIGRDGARAVAAGAGLAAGLLKEISDRRRGGGFSLRDLAWDAAGVAAALFVLGAT
jgi:uncharacterized protein YfiM (DUF2279 family)